MNNLLNIEYLSFVNDCGETQVYSCEQYHFEEICFELLRIFPYTWFVDLFVDNKDGLYANYIFFDMENAKSFKICFKINTNTPLKSLYHMWRNASVAEQEAYELFGIKFNRDYEKKYFTESSAFPMLNSDGLLEVKEFADQYDLAFKPDNLVFKNLVKINVALNEDNTLINKCMIEPGLHHMGIEKSLEGMSLKSSYANLESYFSSHSSVFADLLSRGLEIENNINVPNRAKSIRMVLLEFNRVLSHYQYLEQLSLEHKHASMHSQIQLAVKKLQALLISYSGNEYLWGTIRLGGVCKDTSQVWLSRVLSEVNWLEGSLLNIYHNILIKKDFKRVLSFNLLSKRIASAWGVTGPLARSVGLNADLRKITPIYFYDDVDFDIPVGVSGTLYDLLLVCVEEIFQSFRIIIQVLDNLPTGDILAPEVKTFRVMKNILNPSDEQSYIDSVENDLLVNDSSFTTFLEGPRGLYSLSLEHKNNINNRLRITSPSTVNAQLYEKILKGRELDVVNPFWVSMYVNLKEAER